LVRLSFGALMAMVSLEKKMNRQDAKTRRKS